MHRLTESERNQIWWWAESVDFFNFSQYIAQSL